MDVGNLISGSSAFSKSRLSSWKFTVHVLLKSDLKNFEHYFASVWDECDCVVVWALFGIAFLWGWSENWPFPDLWPLLSFQFCWNTVCSTLTASSFRIWIAHLEFRHLHYLCSYWYFVRPTWTLHSRVSGSRWVIASLWLSGSWRSFLYSSLYSVMSSVQFSIVQSLSCVQLSATPQIAARQAFLSITNPLEFAQIHVHELVMPSSHLILCHPLLLLLPIPPSVQVFSNESTLHMRWLKYWSFSFSISPSNQS